MNERKKGIIVLINNNIVLLPEIVLWQLNCFQMLNIIILI